MTARIYLISGKITPKVTLRIRDLGSRHPWTPWWIPPCWSWSIGMSNSSDGRPVAIGWADCPAAMALRSWGFSIRTPPVRVLYLAIEDLKDAGEVLGVLSVTYLTIETKQCFSASMLIDFLNGKCHRRWFVRTLLLVGFLMRTSGDMCARDAVVTLGTVHQPFTLCPGEPPPLKREWVIGIGEYGMTDSPRPRLIHRCDPCHPQHKISRCRLVWGLQI